MFDNLGENHRYLFEFVVCINHGNFTDASKELGISTSGLSVHLDDLERNLKNQLFLRKGKKRVIALTVFGKKVYESLAGLESVLKGLDRRGADNNKSPVTIRTSPGLSRLLLPGLNKYLIEQSDKFLLTVTTHDNDNFVKGNEILIRSDILTSSDNVLNILTSLEFCFYASRAYLQKFGIPNSLKDFGTHRLLSPNMLFDYRSNVKNSEILAINPFTADFVCDDVATLLALCVDGQGIIELPKDYPGTQELEVISLGHRSKPRPIYYSYDSTMNNIPTFEAFISIMKDYLRSGFIGK